MQRLLILKRCAQAGASSSKSPAAEGLNRALQWIIDSRTVTPGSTFFGGRGFHGPPPHGTAHPAAAALRSESIPLTSRRHGDTETDFEKTAAERLKDGQPLESSLPDAVATVRRLTKIGSVRQCLEFLGSLEGEGGTRAYNNAISGLPPPQALQVYQQMMDRGVPPNTFTATALAKVYATMGMLRQLDVLMEQLLSRHTQLVHWITFFTWADAHAQAGRFGGVRAVMDVARRYGVPLTSHFWMLQIKALSIVRRFAPGAVDRVLSEMEECGDRSMSHEEAYRAAMKHYSCIGHAARAAAVFQRMLAAGVKPGVDTYAALIFAYADHGMQEQALETLRSMHRAGVRANLQCYVVLMKGFARLGDVRRARAVLTTMEREGITPNKYAYCALVEACVAARDAGAAQRAVDAMRAAGLPLDAIVLTTLISAYAAAGDAASARRVLRDMQRNGPPPGLHAYTRLMQLLGEKGQPDAAGEVFNEMCGQGLRADSITLCALVDSHMWLWWKSRGGKGEEHLRKAKGLFKSVGAGKLVPHVTELLEVNAVLVDLHGYSCWTGQLAVLYVLQGLLKQYQWSKPRRRMAPGLRIVTGRGNRSDVRHRSQLREAVMKLLQPLVPVRLAPGNDGLLLVSSSQMLRLLRFMTRRGHSFDPVSMKGFLVEPGGGQEGGRGVKMNHSSRCC